MLGIHSYSSTKRSDSAQRESAPRESAQRVLGASQSVAQPVERRPVGRARGRILEHRDEHLALSWLAEDGLLVTVEAGSEVDLDLLAAIAGAVEVSG